MKGTWVITNSFVLFFLLCGNVIYTFPDSNDSNQQALADQSVVNSTTFPDSNDSNQQALADQSVVNSTNVTEAVNNTAVTNQYITELSQPATTQTVIIPIVTQAPPPTQTVMAPTSQGSVVNTADVNTVQQETAVGSGVQQAQNAQTTVIQNGNTAPPPTQTFTAPASQGTVDNNAVINTIQQETAVGSGVQQAEYSQPTVIQSGNTGIVPYYVAASPQTGVYPATQVNPQTVYPTTQGSVGNTAVVNSAQQQYAIGSGVQQAQNAQTTVIQNGNTAYPQTVAYPVNQGSVGNYGAANINQQQVAVNSQNVQQIQNAQTSVYQNGNTGYPYYPSPYTYPYPYPYPSQGSNTAIANTQQYQSSTGSGNSLQTQNSTTIINQGPTSSPNTTISSSDNTIGSGNNLSGAKCSMNQDYNDAEGFLAATFQENYLDCDTISLIPLTGGGSSN